MTNTDRLAALLPRILNFRLGGALPVESPIWQEIAASLIAAGVTLLDEERLARALQHEWLMRPRRIARAAAIAHAYREDSDD